MLSFLRDTRTEEQIELRYLAKTMRTRISHKVVLTCSSSGILLDRGISPQRLKVTVSLYFVGGEFLSCDTDRTPSSFVKSYFCSPIVTWQSNASSADTRTAARESNSKAHERIWTVGLCRRIMTA